jgi:ParB family chromosome partitioning protein
MSEGKAPDKPRRRPLGRGLDALLGSAGDTAANDRSVTTPQGRRSAASGDTAAAPPNNRVPVERIRTGRFQPRRRFGEAELEELAGSIRARGVLQPLLVRPHPDSSGDYELIAGERRWRAAQRAQVHDVPVVVLPLSDLEALEVALVENVQRQDLTPLEEADGYARLIDEFEHSQEDLARVVGKSRSHVANMLRLRALPEGVKTYLDSGALTMGHARALLTARSPESLAKRIVDGGLSVRAAERLANATKPEKAGRRGTARAGTAPPGGRKDADTRALEKQVSDSLGLTTEIVARGERGQLVVHFTALEQLDDLIDRLTRR